jgi:hypothetical protein
LGALGGGAVGVVGLFASWDGAGDVTREAVGVVGISGLIRQFAEGALARPPSDTPSTPPGARYIF